MIKNRFRSKSEHSLDAKGRLNFPSRFRSVLAHCSSEELVMVSWKSHLRIYPVAEWEIVENKLLAHGAEQPKQQAKFIRLLVASVTMAQLDRQNRILVPPDLRNDTGLDREVVVTGMIDWIEVWDKERWQAETEATRNEFEEHEASLARIGIL